jgi:hypothetical protein
MKKERSWNDLDDLSTPFLPDESTETATAVAIELRSRIVKLEQQVLAQYTAMASYATIAQRDVEQSRAEARADLDRSQATVVGLIEKARHEAALKVDAVANTVGAGPTGDHARLVQMEQRMVTMAQLLERIARDNAELRRQLTVLSERTMTNEGWLVSDGTDSLSLT